MLGISSKLVQNTSDQLPTADFTQIKVYQSQIIKTFLSKELWRITGPHSANSFLEPIKAIFTKRLWLTYFFLFGICSNVL